MKHRLALIAAGLVLIAMFWNQISWWFVAIFAFFFIALLSWASFDIRSQYFVQTFWKGVTSEKKVALTFDDGPTELTPDFLELLKKYNCKATFFCIGKQVEKFPDITRQIISAGHEIGNHTYSHSNTLGFLSAKKYLEEIKAADKSLFEACQLKTKLFRPPFGVTNPNVSAAVKTSRKFVIGWSIRSMDTVLKSPQKISARVIRKIKPGSVILMHDTSENSLEALSQILVFLEHEGYEMLTVSELFNFHK